MSRVAAAVVLIVFVLALGPARAAPAAGRSEPVSFHNGDVRLSGTLYLPATKGPHPAIVALHAAGGGTRDFHAYRHLADALPDAGFAVLLYDRRGSGESSGDFSSATFPDLARDGLAGVALLKRRPDIDASRIGVWGASQGGGLGPLAASLSGDIAFVVAVSGPGVTPARQMDYAAETALVTAGRPRAVVERALRVRAVVNKYFRGKATRAGAQEAIAGIRREPWFEQVFLPGGGDLPEDPTRTKWAREMDYNPLPPLARVRVPMAFFFATADPWVPVGESIAAIRRALSSHPDVTIRRIPDADHLMETGAPDSGGPTSEEYLRQLLAWLQLRSR